jgi:hypothetical protein
MTAGPFESSVASLRAVRACQFHLRLSGLDRLQGETGFILYTDCCPSAVPWKHLPCYLVRVDVRVEERVEVDDRVAVAEERGAFERVAVPDAVRGAVRDVVRDLVRDVVRDVVREDVADLERVDVVESSSSICVTAIKLSDITCPVILTRKLLLFEVVCRMLVIMALPAESNLYFKSYV